MKTKEITLCGKQVSLSYCYATEISYKMLADEEIENYMADAVQELSNNKMPDIRRSIFLIIAAMQAFYEPANEEIPIDDKALMYECSPKDMGTAIGTILSLRSQFYHVPSGEPEDKKEDTKENDEKNV